MNRAVGIGILLFSLAIACVEPFDPNIKDKDVDFLVVEGYIHAGTGATKVLLSKVSPLRNGNSMLYEEDAEVSIENDAHETFALSQTNPGVYVSDTLTLPTDRKYQLRIKRSNGKVYISEMLPAKVTPPIDSLHWEWKDQLYIYANAHDSKGETQFYSWTFREDWEIKSQFFANLKYEKDTIKVMFPSDALRMHDCWGKEVSNKMVIASTQLLTEDAISYPITTIAASSEKIQHKYSIWAYQRAMTEDEYNYLVLMKKNSEQTGSFFDPMPSQLFGNIHREGDANELVVGYVGVYTTQQLRLFIDGSKLPPNSAQEKCDPVDFEFTPENLETFLSNPSVLWPYQTYFENGNLSKPRVIALPSICMDCRLKPGASSVHPDWDPEM